MKTLDTLIFGLYPDASSYLVILHDLQFYLNTETPLIFPRILFEYKDEVNFYVKISLLR